MLCCVVLCDVCGVCVPQKEKNAPELDRQADELQKEALAVKIDEVRKCNFNILLFACLIPDRVRVEWVRLLKCAIL